MFLKLWIFRKYIILCFCKIRKVSHATAKDQMGFISFECYRASVQSEFGGRDSFFFFNDHLKNQFSKLLKVCESSMKAKQTLTSLWVYILHHLATPGSARSLVSPYFCLQTIQTALRDHERYSVS